MTSKINELKELLLSIDLKSLSDEELAHLYDLIHLKAGEVRWTINYRKGLKVRHPSTDKN